MGLFGLFRSDPWAEHRVAYGHTLYDGSDDARFYRGTFAIGLSTGETLQESVDSLNEAAFDADETAAPEDLRRSLARQCGLVPNSFDPAHWMDASGWLDVQACLRPCAETGQEYLILSSSGEKQPQRFVVLLHGVWKLAPGIVTFTV